MINRLKGYYVEARPPPEPELYLVSVLRDDFIVTAAEAARILEQADAWGAPWIRFTDFLGATVYARSEYISVVRECMEAEREAALGALEGDGREEPDGDGSEESTGPGERDQEEDRAPGPGG